MSDEDLWFSPVFSGDDRTMLLAVRDRVERSSDDNWCVDVVRSADGSRNCLLGHVFAMGTDDAEGNRWLDWFESVWCTSYKVFPVNDGTDECYPQATPRLRSLALIDNLLNGLEEPTMVSMNRHFELVSERPVERTRTVATHDDGSVSIRDRVEGSPSPYGDNGVIEMELSFDAFREKWFSIVTRAPRMDP